MRSFATIIVLASCGIRAPAPVDVTAMVAHTGPVDARRDLEIRIFAHPRDTAPRLALADLDERIGRPAEALEQLEIVAGLGGPIGTRWHHADQLRFGRLLLVRGRARLARGSASALADLELAASSGVEPTADELERAQLAIALAKLRHVDPAERADGRKLLVELTVRDPSWRGARPDADAVAHGTFGAWLWTVGARREAYEQLAAWHGATKAPRDAALQAAYLRALAWWSPVWLGEVHAPPAADLVGPERCRFPLVDCDAVIADEPPPVPPPPPVNGDPRAIAAAYYAITHVTGGPDEPALRAIAIAFSRDPSVAEQRSRDLVATAADAAVAHAALGALFDALDDPARARIEWQAAVDASAEPAFVRGLAEAAGRTGDAPAAIVFAITAAAAWGDPAVVWTSVARVIEHVGHHVEALEAASSALDLAGPEVLPQALDIAITASRALGRQTQVEALEARRALLAPRTAIEDPTDPRGAIAAYRGLPTAGTIARMWVASRAHVRDVELRATLLPALAVDDPRRTALIAELVGLAGDPDPETALSAVLALK